LNRLLFSHAARAGFLAGAIGLICLAGPLAAAAQPAPASRDGSHDFDFNFGVWHTHIKRIANPFSGGDRSTELDGTVTVRKVWGGRAQIEEIKADGPDAHLEGLTLFIYNPQAGQWSQAFSSSDGASSDDPLVGAFKDGRGELFAKDTFDGRTILVRGEWSDITPDAHRFEEFLSDDGGASWHPEFIAQLTRLSH